MPKKIAKTDTISHEEWLEQRRKGIGGSDAATIVGLNPYNSLYALWADKQGFLPTKDDNEAMRVGRDLEEYVARRFCEATGKKVRRTNYIYAHDDFDFIRANVDREIIGENAGLECKTTSAYAKSDFDGGEIPLNYLCQCYHYMNVMGYDKMYLAVLVMGKGFYWYEIPADKAEQKALLNAEIDFWRQYIEGNEIPAPDGSESSAMAVAAVNPEDSKEIISLIPYETDLKNYAELLQSIKEREREAEAIKQTVQAFMGTAGLGESRRYKVSWKAQQRTTVDSRKLKADFPDIYKQVTKTTESRVFRFAERN